MAVIEITEESPLQDAVRELLRQSDEFALALYPPESNHLVGAEDLATDGVRFFVARANGNLVGCGALQSAPPEGEIKRMFVTAAARGLGVGAAVLRALEAAARADRIATLRLETGIHNGAALQLYNRAGYVERGPFADYGHDPLSVFMEKRLLPA